MSLRPRELEQVARELDEGLRGAIVQRVYLPTVQRAYLELRHPGRSTLLCVSVEPNLARLSVASARGVREPSPPALQRVVRVQLTGARLMAIATEPPLTARLRFERQGEPRTLEADLAHATLTLFGADGAALGGRRPPSPAPKLDPEAPSRLVPEPGSAFPLATAAESLLEQRGQQLEVEALRRARLAPLKTRRARIERTIAKVREEAARGPRAEEHRRLGELLGQNLFRLKRGERKVRLTEYTAEGPREVEVPLDPTRTPKEEVDWHFHQYRRLTRGTERARERLLELERERDEVDAAIARLRELDAEALREGAPVEVTSREAGPARHRPYKEYRGADGGRILVGRGGAENDALTFKIARPQDLWLHVRGVPGAHVVVPLERGAELPQELLIDAAHLAVQHSSVKGEPRAEVSYTYAKFVRKPKGGAAGAVTYTHERSFVVRIEPERIERLLASRIGG